MSVVLPSREIKLERTLLATARAPMRERPRGRAESSRRSLSSVIMATAAVTASTVTQVLSSVTLTSLANSLFLT